MTNNRGFTSIPPSIIEAIDRLTTASFKLGEAVYNTSQLEDMERDKIITRLQSHEDVLYDNLLMLIDNKIARY